MYNWICSIFWMGIVGIILPLSGYTQPQSFTFSNLSRENGLSGNKVLATTQDSLGFLWVATTNGLCRYDDYNSFKVFRKDEENPERLQVDVIETLYTDRKGMLWIGTRLGGLTRLNPWTYDWKTYRHDPTDPHSLSNDEILSITEDRYGNILVGTEDGLNVLDLQQDCFFSFRVDRNDPQALQGKSVLEIFIDRQDRIWIGTWRGGLSRFFPNYTDWKKSTFRSFHIPLGPESQSVWEVYEDPKGRLWIGEDSGLFIGTVSDSLTPAASQFLTCTRVDALSHNRVLSMAQDDKQNVWLGTEYGLDWVPAASISQLDLQQEEKSSLKVIRLFADQNTSTTIPDNYVDHVYWDAQSNLWISTTKGIGKFKWTGNKFTITNTKFNGTCVMIGTDSAFYHGQGMGDLYRYDSKTHTSVPVHLEPSYTTQHQFWHLLPLPQDEVLITTDSSLAIYDLYAGKKRFEAIFNHTNTLARVTSRDGIMYYKDRIWIGSSNGITIVNPLSGERLRYQNDPQYPGSLVNNAISSFEFDPEGNLWISTYNGLSMVSKNQLDNLEHIQELTFQNYTAGSNYPALSTNKFTNLENVDTGMMIGTPTGLIYYDYASQRFRQISTEGSRPWIENIAYVAPHHVWCSTTEGILHYNMDTKAEIVYYEEYGLNRLNFNAGAILRPGKNRLIFASSQALVSFDPNKGKQHSENQTAYLTQMRSINPQAEEVQNLIGKTRVTLPPSNYYISLDYTALNYENSTNVKYAYRLQGFESEWNYPEKRMAATYTNLDPGEYTFQVRVTGTDGVWKEPVELLINKEYAIYETATFRYGLPLLILLLGFLYTISLIRRRKNVEKLNQQLSSEIRRREEMEEQLLEKNKELARSNHDLEQFAYITSHDFQSPLTTIQGFGGLLKKRLRGKLQEEEQRFLDYILKSTLNLRQLVTDSLRYSTLDAEDLQLTSIHVGELIQEIKLDLSAIIRESNTQLIFQDLDIEILADRYKARQLFQNLITNAIKYVPEGTSPKITLTTEESDTHVVIHVKDNGIGISDAHKDKIFQLFQRLHNRSQYDGTGIGLSICKKIVDLHGGEIEVQSAEGKGSTFSVSFPKRVNKFRSEKYALTR